MMIRNDCRPVTKVSRGHSLATPVRARAWYYQGVLKQLDVIMGQQSVPANYALFFRQLRSNLETALGEAEGSVAAPTIPREGSDSAVELDWLCCQCEHWLGPFEQVDLEVVCQKCAVYKPASPAMTAGEYTAVRLLLHTVTFLVRAKHNRRAWLPNPIAIGRRICRGMLDRIATLRFAGNVRFDDFKKRLRRLLPRRPPKHLTIQEELTSPSGCDRTESTNTPVPRAA
jgi:hypothetical protein